MDNLSKKEELREYVETGREIEFELEGIWYSITYFEENGKDYISFCEANKYPIDVETFEELCDIVYKGRTVLQLWEEFDEEVNDYIIA